MTSETPKKIGKIWNKGRPNLWKMFSESESGKLGNVNKESPRLQSNN